MDANLQQWAGELNANASVVARIILTSDLSYADIYVLQEILTHIKCTADAMKGRLEQKNEA